MKRTKHSRGRSIKRNERRSGVYNKGGDFKISKNFLLIKKQRNIKLYASMTMKSRKLIKQMRLLRQVLISLLVQ